MSRQFLPGRWVSLLVAAATLSLSACSVDLWRPTRGRLALSVKWPEQAVGFRVLAIPAGTARVVVTIRGEGIPEKAPMQAILTPDPKDSSTQFLDVPIGPKFIDATAYDAADRRTAFAAQAISVLPNTLVEARLVLQPVGTPAPLPVASDVVATEPATTTGPLPSIAPARVLDTFAGDGLEGALDAKDPHSARFKHPRSLHYDASRQLLFVADAGHRLIRVIDMRTGEVRTVAGRAAQGSEAPSGVPPALAGAAAGVPSGLAVGPDGSLYYCDRDNHMVRRIAQSGLVETVAGTGFMGYVDGPAASAQFAYPSQLVVDPDGTVYVADTYNNRVRRIQAGQVTTLAGEGTNLAAEAKGLRLAPPSLNLPIALALSADRAHLYVAEGKGRRISRLDIASRQLTPVAGSGRLGVDGEGGDARGADLALPLALALDAQGGLLIADGWACSTGLETLLGASSRILRLAPDGTLQRVAGNASKSAYGFSGDGEDPLRAELNNPAGLAVDAGGRIFLADSYNHRIRVIRPAPLAASEPSPSVSPSSVASSSASSPASPSAAIDPSPTAVAPQRAASPAFPAPLATGDGAKPSLPGL
ncbi:MAG: SMP-30/gluconolactonase/LRE family protein [Candidatus Sericytochromatia bacterium]|nr:SMP-30/gluconolactonase/LRE family protein [Candidatus Sericytochromatia bacterium]